MYYLKSLQISMASFIPQAIDDLIFELKKHWWPYSFYQFVIASVEMSFTLAFVLQSALAEGVVITTASKMSSACCAISCLTKFSDLVLLLWLRLTPN